MIETELAISSVFPNKKVVIVGDLVADQYLSGTIDRVSREAPVFILRHDETVTMPGAAANAAANVASLGGRAVVVGVTGNDASGTELRAKLAAAGVDTSFVIVDDNLFTTTKVRILAGQKHAVRQQVIRVDYADQTPLSAELRERLIDNLRAAADGADAIIVSDYDYGVAEGVIYAEVRRIAADRGIPLTVDSRFRLAEFPGATSATPNQEEVEQMLGKDFTGADCESLRERSGLEALLITNGSKGMVLIERGREPLQIDAVGSLEAVDVTGAGDTVIAVYSLALASGLAFAEAAMMANYAGGLVVMKKGTATLTGEELLTSMRTYQVAQLAKEANTEG